MEETSLPPIQLPPPPPPQKPRTGLWIGIAVGAVVLCLCCVLVIVGVYLAQQGKIPGLSSLFATPTPEGKVYSGNGISLQYPTSWYNSDAEAYMIVFASSQEIINNIQNSPDTGAAFVILNPLASTSDLSSSVSPTDAPAVLEWLLTDRINGGFTEIESPRASMIGSYPAATGVYTSTGTNGMMQNNYLTVIVKDPDILLIIAFCPQTEWSLHRPTFDSILISISFP